ncbi:hypothetical protein ABLN64_04450 [Mycobacterium tuberculosis]
MKRFRVFRAPLTGDGTAGNWPAGCVRGGRGLRAGVGSAPLR